MSPHEHALERTVVIHARPDTVFRYFTDSERFARWWGAGSTIEARPGGPVEIHMPGGVRVLGEVREVVPGERIVFTYGYASGSPIPAGASEVTVELTAVPQGTRLTLTHRFDDPGTRDLHVGGWRYQLAVFANVAAADQHANLAQVLDDYFAAWAEPEAARRAELLGRSVADDVEFRDAFGCTSGRADLAAHVAAVQVHMPGLSLARVGAPRHCQGMALVDWDARGADGVVRDQGVNVVQLAPDGRLVRVVGFRQAPA